VLLIIGALVYLTDRPPGETYFVFSLPVNISLYGVLPPIFGSLANFLPDFLHVLAFILLTAGFAGCGKKGYLIICLFWLIADAGFELGQKFGAAAAQLVPDWFDKIFLLENTKNYFTSGTYSHIDMVAIFCGAACGYVILIYTEQQEEPSP